MGSSSRGRVVCIQGVGQTPIVTSSGGHCSCQYASYWNAFLFFIFLWSHDIWQHTFIIFREMSNESNSVSCSFPVSLILYSFFTTQDIFAKSIYLVSIDKADKNRQWIVWKTTYLHSCDMQQLAFESWESFQFWKIFCISLPGHS